MAIFISIVSHGHEHLIEELQCISSLSKEFIIVIKSNTPNEDFRYLDNRGNIFWIDSLYKKGFGENNNIVFNYCYENLAMQDDDYFIVLNPDVVINNSNIKELVSQMKRENVSIAAINLYKNKEKNIYDNSIRKFPDLISFIRSFVGLRNNMTIDKNNCKVKCAVDWAAGSFLAFKCEHYRKLSGFDEGYFMYCEDVDICYRSKKKGNSVVYYPNITALHLAQHANRKLFSKHFIWHVKSVVRFLLSKKSLVKPKSSISL